MSDIWRAGWLVSVKFDLDLKWRFYANNGGVDEIHTRRGLPCLVLRTRMSG